MRAKFWFKCFDVLQVHSQPGFVLDQGIAAEPDKQTWNVSCSLRWHNICFFYEQHLYLYTTPDC